jgi:hypothetical protein
MTGVLEALSIMAFGLGLGILFGIWIDGWRKK